MAAAVGAELHELGSNRRALMRYSALSWRTVSLVRRSRPDVIFFQNPSIVLATLVVLMKAIGLTRAAVVGDFHNAGVFPPVGAVWVPFLVRGCDLVIVSNESLAARVTAMGGRSLPVPDPLPYLPQSSAADHRRERFLVLMVCSWASDEPVSEVLRAAQILRMRAPRVSIAVTGRPALEKCAWTDALPENVELTGFLSDTEFERRLGDSDVIMDLTTRPDCMVCGAYEAVSAEVPVILSDNGPTKQYFGKGCLFTDNTALDIAARVLEAMDRRIELMTGIRQLKAEILAREEAALKTLLGAVRGDCT